VALDLALDFALPTALALAFATGRGLLSPDAPRLGFGCACGAWALGLCLVLALAFARGAAASILRPSMVPVMSQGIDHTSNQDATKASTAQRDVSQTQQWFNHSHEHALL
jgi:hypothetical protein